MSPVSSAFSCKRRDLHQELMSSVQLDRRQRSVSVSSDVVKLSDIGVGLHETVRRVAPTDRLIGVGHRSSVSVATLQFTGKLDVCLTLCLKV